MLPQRGLCMNEQPASPTPRLGHHHVHRTVTRKPLRHFFHAAATPVAVIGHRHRYPLAIIGLLLAVQVFIILPVWGHAQRREASRQQPLHLLLKLPPLPADQNDRTPTLQPWRTVRVHAGQSLADVFAALGLTPAALQQLVDIDAGRSGLARIHPGQRFEFRIGPHGALQAVRFDRDDSHRVVFDFSGPSPIESVQIRPLERWSRIAHGTIHGSLVAAGDKAGMNPAMILQMAKVFGYDIDFAQDLRDGDAFTVLYDNVYRDGAYLHPGEIIAAEFVNQGRHYSAFRFRLADGSVGYYSKDGRPLKKSFLRTPVDFTRISSRFSSARRHPILGTMRAHKGVDYAAPRGTPIYAAGKGVIVFRGREHGYGNFVLIRHSRRISTAYGHMSRFAKGLHRGEHVRQGQIIGYVGMTGLATGPHLHYEFRVNGVQRNPLTVTLPKPKPLPHLERLAFKQSIQPLLARLQRAKQVSQLAQAR